MTVFKVDLFTFKKENIITNHVFLNLIMMNNLYKIFVV